VILLGKLSIWERFTRKKPRKREKMKEEGKRRDVEKERYWRKVVGEAARSGIPIRRFCQQWRLRGTSSTDGSPASGRERSGSPASGRVRLRVGRQARPQRNAVRRRLACPVECGGELGSAGIERALRDRRHVGSGKEVYRDLANGGESPVC
jgi:hypothetical protein